MSQLDIRIGTLVRGNRNRNPIGIPEYIRQIKGYGFESLQLSPGSVLQLFKSLGEQSATRAKQWSTGAARCRTCPSTF